MKSGHLNSERPIYLQLKTFESFIYETQGCEYNLLFLKEHHNHEHQSENGNSAHQLQTQT